MENSNVKKMVQISLLIATSVVLSRFLSIATPIVKIGFAFLPIAIAGFMYGPAWGAVTGGVADFIGAILFPIGPYFPGFTLTAALSGMTYGLVLHKKEKSLYQILLAVSIITVFLHLGLNTLWLVILSGKGALGLLPSRIIQQAVMVPVQVASIYIAANNAQLRKAISSWT